MNDDTLSPSYTELLRVSTRREPAFSRQRRLAGWISEEVPRSSFSRTMLHPRQLRPATKLLEPVLYVLVEVFRNGFPVWVRGACFTLWDRHESLRCLMRDLPFCCMPLGDGTSRRPIACESRAGTEHNYAKGCAFLEADVLASVR
ncbi:uncharacterized protein PHALS_06315 [Plasmopara halstedii]|uniref:Uncharacterized protein n=1 Tax=Plasmopara halstedii TaxID=4781 RepID=A0A0P1B345_PLAHL|nr:uncharacterized protein PHALS_06315 [Plasmopara halstedii]CEG48496.1 hypothetical protein PHALS_06315 [Plasmopara halstedii]|eukprot:XP_024584865.1 hypothetical protein PHALS_06315 [Plasmopara halstedii]